jgi:hypothetical protein
MSTQYPVNTAGVRYLPTIPGYKVKKFKPSTGYEEMEKLKDENGLPYLYNGVNLEYTYDIEMTPLVTYTTPVELTALTFTASSAANAFPYPGQATYAIHVLVVGKVEEAQDEAGKIALLSFKAVTSANIP